MKLLALDSTATAASVALMEDGMLRGEFFINTKLTHSQTLMPMVEALLNNTCIPLSQVDAFAVAAGPGSFTGVRIGVAAVKGMAMAMDKPCVSVSTLEAMACQLAFLEGLVCAAMDARCNQVYNALFEVSAGTVRRLTPDRALPVEELGESLANEGKQIFFVGDGAQLCYNKLNGRLQNACLAPVHLRYQRASGVALAAEKQLQQGKTLSAGELTPVYLRPPQAERELKKRQLKGE